MAYESANLPTHFDMKTAAAAGIAAACAALDRGELVAMPTETVYGLAADAANAEAVGRIFLAKGRPRFNPLIAHFASLADARRYADFSPEAEHLAAAFWPGPLTMVLPKKPDAPLADLVTAGLDTVAVRLPAHPVAHALLSAFGRPVAAPSANRSGHVSTTTAAHVATDLGRNVSVILDAGPTLIGLESTIVGLAGDRPQLLRAGGIASQDIAEVLGTDLALAEADDHAPAAPGMLTSHYAPVAKVRLEATAVRPGEALLAFGPDLPADTGNAIAVVNLSPGGDTTEAAVHLFSALRELDRRATAIAVMPIPDEGLGEAINDRLRRAAAPRG